jgi:ADP-heptose:LPS heptosyltransferase
LRVTLLANSEWAEFARELALFDDVIEVDLKRFSKRISTRWALAKKLRKAGFQIAVLSMYSRTMMTDMMVHLSGARERVGPTSDFSNIDLKEKRISDRWYTRLIPSRPHPMMEAFRNAEFVSEIIGEHYQPRLARWDTVLQHSLAVGSIEGLPLDEPYYVLHPGASSGEKRWPIEKFGEIAKLIWQQTGWRGVVCGGPGDQGLADVLCSIPAVPLISLAGRIRLSQMVAIIARARLLVTNDTSASHMGAAARIPTICISGGWHYGRFWPYPENLSESTVQPRVVFHKMSCFGCNWICPYERRSGEPVPCVDRIRVEDVASDVLAVLARTKS